MLPWESCHDYGRYHAVPKPGWRAFQLLVSHAGTLRVEATVQGACRLPRALRSRVTPAPSVGSAPALARAGCRAPCGAELTCKLTCTRTSQGWYVEWHCGLT